jgi:hypothetical protein
MPVPLVALALAAGGGLVTGYAIDHLVGDSQYTKEEALLDVGLGVVGGSLVKPAIRVGQRLRTGVRVSAGRPTTFERLAYRAKTERVFASKRDAAMYTTGSRSGGDLKRITKFFGVSGGHSYYLASRGSGAPTGSTSTRTKRPRKGRSRPFSPRSGGAKAPKSARTTYKETRKGRQRSQSTRRSRCPPGHYWSKRYKKCIRHRKN